MWAWLLLLTARTGVSAPLFALTVPDDVYDAALDSYLDLPFLEGFQVAEPDFGTFDVIVSATDNGTVENSTEGVLSTRRAVKWQHSTTTPTPTRTDPIFIDPRSFPTKAPHTETDRPHRHHHVYRTSTASTAGPPTSTPTQSSSNGGIGPAAIAAIVIVVVALAAVVVGIGIAVAWRRRRSTNNKTAPDPSNPAAMTMIASGPAVTDPLLPPTQLQLSVVPFTSSVTRSKEVISAPERLENQLNRGLEPDHIGAEQFRHQGVLHLQAKENLDLHHELENDKTRSIRPSDHITFDSTQFVVRDIGPGVEVVHPDKLAPLLVPISDGATGTGTTTATGSATAIGTNTTTTNIPKLKKEK